MARIAALMELQPTNRRNPQDARYDQGCDTSPDGDLLMEHILENMNTTPPEEVLKRITSLPPTDKAKCWTSVAKLRTGPTK